MNHLYYSDNLAMLREHIRNESIALIYFWSLTTYLHNATLSIATDLSGIGGRASLCIPTGTQARSSILTLRVSKTPIGNITRMVLTLKRALTKESIHGKQAY